MKKLLFPLIFLVFVGAVSSQTIIENPKFGVSTTNSLTVTKIERTPEATILSFTVKIPRNGSVNLHGKSYIQPVGSDSKLYVTKAEGIENATEIIWTEAKSEISYRLFFPKIGASVNKIDFVEPDEKDPRKIMDIGIRETSYQSAIPNDLTGNWFSSENGNWSFSFYDSLAIFDKSAWKYESVKPGDGILEVKFKKAGQEKNLFIKAVGENECMAGLSEKDLKKYSKNFSRLTKSEDAEAFKVSVLRQGKVVYRGYIRGFTPRLEIKTGMVRFYNQLACMQESHLIKIADDGSFNVEFQLNYPQEVSVILPTGKECLFFEPGKDLFHLVNSGIPGSPSLFMGESAAVNYGLRATQSIGNNTDQLTTGIMQMDQAEYMNRVLAIKQAEQDELRKIQAEQSICRKAVQIRELDIEFRAVNNAISYNRNVRRANYLANKTLKKEEQHPFVPRKFDLNLPGGIKYAPINSDLALISREYFYLLQNLKYMEFSRPQVSSFCLLCLLGSQLEKQKIEITPKEKEMLAFVKTNMVDSYDDNMVSKFNKDYGSLKQKFCQKYMTEFLEILDSSYKENLDLNLRQIFGVSGGLTLEMNALQNFLRGINSAEPVLNDVYLEKVKSEISIGYLEEFAISEYYRKQEKQGAKTSANTIRLKTENDRLFNSSY